MTKDIIKNIKCDKCDKIFIITKIRSRVVGKYQANIVRFNFFQCPHCKHKYFTGVDEKNFNELMAEYRKNVNMIHLLDMVSNAEEIRLLKERNAKLHNDAKALTEMFKVMFQSWR